MPSHIEFIVVPKLNKILKERKMTQSQLAELTGITQASISRFDRNKQHTDAHLIAISRVLNISIEDLFDVKEVGQSYQNEMLSNYIDQYNVPSPGLPEKPKPISEYEYIEFNNYNEPVVKPKSSVNYYDIELDHLPKK